MYISEQFIKQATIGKIFLLPISNRPDDFPPLSSKMKGDYWHVGIVYKGKVYECFNQGRYRVSPARERFQDPEFANAKFFNYPINLSKLKSELTSGTDDAEYVARVIGMSKTRGSDKGKHWPEDIYNFLLKY